MGKILEKEGNVILLEFSDLVNNLFSEIAQGISSFSFLGHMNIHTTSLVKMAKYHHFAKFVAKKHCFGTY